MDDGLRLEEHTHTVKIKLNLLTLSKFHSNQLSQGEKQEQQSRMVNTLFN